MKTCAYCRSELPEDAVTCPNCAGTSFSTQAEPAADSAQTLAESGVRAVSAVGMLVVAAMAGLFVLGFFVVWVLVLLGWDLRF